jgi:acyl-CoA hydrolase
MAVYLVNAFSLGMLTTKKVTLYVEEVDEDTAVNVITTMKSKGELTSAVGHESTAKILSEICGVEIECNRIPIKLQPKDAVIIFQLLDRLPEGKILTIEEIRALKYKFYLVKVVE